LDFDYKIFGRAHKDANASATVHTHYKDDILTPPSQSDVFLHPMKCTQCRGFFDDVELQTLVGLNHEIQESLVVEILRENKKEYKTEWFDRTCQNKDSVTYIHSCENRGIMRLFGKLHKETIRSSGYFR